MQESFAQSDAAPLDLLCLELLNEQLWWKTDWRTYVCTWWTWGQGHIQVYMCTCSCPECSHSFHLDTHPVAGTHLDLWIIEELTVNEKVFKQFLHLAELNPPPPKNTINHTCYTWIHILPLVHQVLFIITFLVHEFRTAVPKKSAAVSQLALMKLSVLFGGPGF